MNLKEHEGIKLHKSEEGNKTPAEPLQVFNKETKQHIHSLINEMYLTGISENFKEEDAYKKL